MDLEDMETHRATSGVINPSTPAWDPEKMKLCHMVDRLLALEERRVLMARTAEVKLPAVWFRLMEIVMEDIHVRDPRVK